MRQLTERGGHLLGQLLSIDKRLNGELATMDEDYRTIAEILDQTPFAERQAKFEQWLGFQPDPEAIVQTVADGDPKGEIPEETSEEWPGMRLATPPRAVPFPIDILPPLVQELAKAGADSIGCSVDFLAIAILGAASGLIGRSVSLMVKDGYFATALLYMALVGGPSSGKSPALRVGLGPALKISGKLYRDWQPQMDDWKECKQAERGPEPQLSRLVSTDSTTEALGLILAKNPRGMIVAPDEMTKWVMTMDQYKNGKGGDRQFWLSVWNGEPIYIDRAKFQREPIVVPHPFLTVVGGMTPDMLTSLPEGRGRDDGFMARLLFSYPDRVVRRFSDRGIPTELATDWETASTSLWERSMLEKDGESVPRVVKMTAGATSTFAEWCRAHYAEQEAFDFRDSLEGVWGKFEAYVPRLALNLHLLNLASDLTRTAQDGIPALPKQVMEASIKVLAYFKDHALRVYAATGRKSDDGGDDVRMLVRWIRLGNRTEFSVRDITRNTRRFKDDPAALDDALLWMADHKIIRRQARVDDGQKRGRPRSVVYEINPQLKGSSVQLPL